MKLHLIILILFAAECLKSQPADNPVSALEDSNKTLNNRGVEAFITGDFITAEALLKQTLELSLQLYPPNHLNIAHDLNNLGVLCINQWHFDNGLDYFNRARKIYMLNDAPALSMANLYSNMGNAYRHKGDFTLAVEYFDEALKLLGNLNSTEAILRKIETLNRFALLENSRKNYSEASRLSNLAISEFSRHNLQQYITLHDIYITAAISFKNRKMADSSFFFIQQSLLLFDKHNYHSPQLHCDSYKHLAEYYLSTNQPELALKAIRSAESIYIQSSIDSKYYFDIMVLNGNYWKVRNDFEKAVSYYQMALKYLQDQNGNDTLKIQHRSLLHTISLLNTLSDTYIAWYAQKKNFLYLEFALKNLHELALVIHQIRQGYLSVESKLYLSDKESQVYSKGLDCAERLYSVTGQYQYLEEAFYFAEQSKSSVLLGVLSEEKAKKFAGIPDSLIEKESRLKREIAFYNEKVYEESIQLKPDQVKLDVWKSYLFNFSRQYELLKNTLDSDFPEYYSLKYKTNLSTIPSLQSSLDRNTTLLEYSLSDTSLFLFVINRKEVYFYRTQLNNALKDSLRNYINEFKNFDFSGQNHSTYSLYYKRAFFLYQQLLSKVNQDKLKKNLVIIPDGLISYIPFEALVDKPSALPIKSFNNLNYLVYNYTISYAYSSSIYSEMLGRGGKKLWNKTLSVAPDYSARISQQAKNTDEYKVRNYRNYLLPLPFALEEALMVCKLTRGNSSLGKDATKENFLEIANNYDILHLAMHTLIDDKNPLFSKLVFADNNLTNDNGFLNTNELFSLKLQAQLTVLSACNSGHGELKNGEGVMSLSRGFFYAGCPSLVITLWRVEDESGKTLMHYFYKNLLKSKSKSEALRLAKLNFLKSAQEQYKHPFFWSSYILIGNADPVYRSPWWIFGGITMILFAGFLFFKIKRN